MIIRIGQGIDIHAFGEGNHVVLGGVKIPHTHGLIAHSDGDVLIHALCDALLGSVALGDIGQHFPDTDPNYKNADSCILLQRVYQLIKTQGYELINADITVMCERPKLAPFNLAIRQQLATLLAVDVGQVSVKATTSEKLGFTGRQEGIFASAVVLVARQL